MAASVASPPAPADRPGQTGSTSLEPYPGGSCPCADAPRWECTAGGGNWVESSCTCISPIVVDVEGDGFDLTDGAAGVSFDITADGVPERISWTSAGSDDAWLALDRDGDGRITSGAEPFFCSPAASAAGGRAEERLPGAGGLRPGGQRG